jgi:hypothetical protein
MNNIFTNMCAYFIFIIIFTISLCGVAFDVDARVLWLMILLAHTYAFINTEVRARSVERRLKKYKKAVKTFTDQIEKKEL